MTNPLWKYGFLVAGVVALIVYSSPAKDAPATMRASRKNPVYNGSPSTVAAESPCRNDRQPLDDVVFFDDLESYQNGQLPFGWTRLDGDGGYSSWFARHSTWLVYSRNNYSAHSGTRFLMCHFNDNAVPNDDWLILPQQRILGTITLSYWACSQDSSYPESFEVRVSTTGTRPQDFTQLVYSTNSVPGEWTHYSHDLSSLVDTPFYLAFHYNATDRFALKIDDVQLEGTLPPYGCIAGLVTDDSAHAISGVRVHILALDLETRTDTEGRFLLTRVSPGDFPLSFQHEFYNPRILPQITVAVNETTFVNPSLLPLPLLFHDYISENSPRTIADFDTAMMPLYGVIHDTLIIYDLDVSFTIQHSYVGDLDIWVRSPDTMYVQLVAHDPENNGQNLVNCRFSDQAEWPFTLGYAPYTGTWQPLQALSAFNGDSTVAIRRGRAYSTWYLAVYDSAAQDVGVINEFAIHVASSMPVPVQNTPRPRPEFFAFDGCYPNPFNAQTKLRFYLPHPARVQLVLYDLTGREVATLLNRNEEAGEHLVTFSAENLPSGVYFARLSAQGFNATRKVVLLK